MKAAGVVALVTVAASLIVVGVVGYKKGWFVRKPTDAQWLTLVQASDNAGWDTFSEISLSDLKKYYKFASANDVLRLTEIANNAEKGSDLSASEEAEFINIVEKSVGHKIVN